MSTFYEAMTHLEKGGEVGAAGIRYRFGPSTETLEMLEPGCATWECALIERDDLAYEWTLFPILVTWEKAFYAMIVEGKEAQVDEAVHLFYSFKEGMFRVRSLSTNSWASASMDQYLKNGNKWEILP